MNNDEFDIKEFENYVKNFNQVYKELETWLKRFLLQQGLRVSALSKKRQRVIKAVDTGFMINNWYVGKEQFALRGKPYNYSTDFDSAFARHASIDDVEVHGGDLVITIGNMAEYSAYVEYGHKSIAGNWVEGRFILTVSMDTVNNAMPSRFNREFKNWLKEKGAI